MKRVFLCLITLIITVAMLPAAQATDFMVMPNVTLAMQEDIFWLSKLKEPSKVIMDQNQITRFNNEVIDRLPETVYDLRQYPSELVRDELVRLITVPKSSETSRYVNGRLVSAEYYNTLRAECNLSGIAPVTSVRYGFTVSRASIRTFPTTDCVTSQSYDREFDNMQETTLDPAEPVILLHQSLSKDWYYVQSYNYRGWLPANVVAIAASRQEWLQYVDSAEFLTVTSSKIIVGENEFAMGAKLPLADRLISPVIVDRLMAGGSYAVKVPLRGPNGELTFELAAVAGDSRVVKGYLPYTRANIISQVFKLQGQRYGWGGMYGGWDCSSLILDVYRSFGFKLPRNADEQEQAAGRTITFAGNARVSQLAGLEPGAAVYMPGHVMMYLGEHGENQYILHALGGYSTTNGRVPVMQVVVSDLSLTLKSGKTYLNALIVGKQFQ